MDAFLTILIDIFFYSLGKGTWALLRLLKVPAGDLGHSGYVVIGLLMLVFMSIALFMLFGQGVSDTWLSVQLGDERVIETGRGER